VPKIEILLVCFVTAYDKCQQVTSANNMQSTNDNSVKRIIQVEDEETKIQLMKMKQINDFKEFFAKSLMRGGVSNESVTTVTNIPSSRVQELRKETIRQ
jgi:hypothetical protein